MESERHRREFPMATAAGRFLLPAYSRRSSAEGTHSEEHSDLESVQLHPFLAHFCSSGSMENYVGGGGFCAQPAAHDRCLDGDSPWPLHAAFVGGQPLHPTNVATSSRVVCCGVLGLCSGLLSGHCAAGWPAFSQPRCDHLGEISAGNTFLLGDGFY